MKTLELRSFESYMPSSSIALELKTLGFTQVTEATIVAEGKFWSRSLYRKGVEEVSISDEIGEVTHLKDPVVTLSAKKETLAAIQKVV
ncbi:MAG: hypothetical protein ACE5KG_00170 [Nitrososphaerales archaeon]